MGVDPTYIRTRFIATEEATTPAVYKEMIVSSTAKDIVYTFLFSGVHGSYLRGSIINLDLDPDNLPERDKSTMDFGGGGGSKAKVWKDTWRAGQGVGSIHDVSPVDDLVARMELEHEHAREQLKIAWQPPKRIL